MKQVGVSILGFLLAATLSAQVTIGGITLEDLTVVATPAAPTSATVVYGPMMLKPSRDNNGLSAVTDLCVCSLVSVISMDEVSHLSFWSHDGGSAVDGVEEFGVYSFDGATRYFEGTVADITGTGRKQVENTVSTPPALPQSSVWMCYAKDSTSASWLFARSGQSGNPAQLANYRHTETCTDGAMPATLTSPSGSFFNGWRATMVLEDLN